MTLSVSILHPRSIVHSSLRFSQLGPGLHVRTVAGVASSQGKVWEVDSQAEEEV